MKICRRPCVYRAANRSVHGCDFFYLTGELRGCETGAACTRFKEGKRLKHVDPTVPPEPFTREELEIKRYLADKKRDIVGLDSPRSGLNWR